MPQSIQDLREQRTKAAKSARELLDQHPGDKWGEEQDTQYNNLIGEIDNLDAQIDRQQKLLDREAEEKHRVEDRAGRDGISTDEATALKQKESEIFRAWMQGGVEGLNAEQREHVQAMRQKMLENAMSTGTGSEGGYLAPDQFSGELLKALKEFGGMREASRVIQTASGVAINWPTTDATSEEGEIVGENAQVTTGETSFGTLPHGTYKFSSKSIALPFELLQDSEIDLEAYVRELLQERLGRITNRMFTTGSGTGQPHGIVTSSASGKIAPTGRVDSATYDDLVDLEHSVDPAYRRSGNVGYMFHDMTLRELKKLKDGDGRPLWVPGVAVSEPDTLNGYRYTINQHMAQLGAGNKPILFGDFAKYIIRDVMQVQFFRMTDSKYTEKGQVGFLAFMRSGGRLMDVGGAVKHFQNADS
ncbi:phage major capsid protein [Halomonas caseinilytica]|uniref:Phage major capsid protein, HK97 family n=1 Tax=Halomonas caseinilytica TaxID=438744 RepID=A0A1M6UHW0_9GAMM|nr:phage major capsid protein [Halomonas caseinilytica]SHK68759.1 phage major capsid protein, HK97 family [Halomonas caseinilytica]